MSLYNRTVAIEANVPLFGLRLEDYDSLFAEKLDLLLKIRAPGRTGSISSSCPHTLAASAECCCSTTAKVLNDADCPVLTAQHAETSSPRQLDHREWVCVVSLDSDSERVLRYASQATESVHANLTLVHVIPANGSDLPVELDLEARLQSAKREAASRRIEALQSAASSHAPVGIAIGLIRDMLTEAARRLRADVLVIEEVRSPASWAACGILAT